MSSGGFPGAGDLYSSLASRLAAPNGAKRTLTEMERHQLQQALLLTRSVKHKTATPTANPGLYHNQQQQHHPYYHASPISPLAHPLSPADNIDYSSCSPHPSAVSCSSSTTTSASGPTASPAHGNQAASLNAMTSQLAFIRQQQQQQQHNLHQQRQLLLLQQQNQLLQRKAGLFPHSSSNNNINGSSIHGTVAAGNMGGGGFGCYSTNMATPTPQHRLAAPILQPAQQQQPPAERAEVRNRLMELEKQLLDDDDDDDDDGGAGSGLASAADGSARLSASPSGADASPAVLSASGWSETMQGLLISSASSCSTPPQPQQQNQQQQQHQQPPTPTTTTSAASSCCSSSSPPTASSSSGSPAPAKQLLMDSAAAITEGNTDTAAATLAAFQRNNSIVNGTGANNIGPRGGAVDAAEQRLNGYMAAALLSRVNNNNSNCSDSSSPCSSDQLRSPEHLLSTHLLYEACPLFKLGFLASNLAVLDATRGAAVIHILDFDVGQGAQLLPLLSALADRPAAARPALVKITAVSDPAANPYTTNVGCAAMVRAAGERLAKAGERAGMTIRFNAVTTRSGGEAAAASDQHPPLSRQAIGCDPDESLVVRLAFHLSHVPDESVTPANPRDDLLRRIRSMNPAVVALAEQELSGNTAPFLPRFADAHAHYAALFDSLHQQQQQDGACTPPMETLTRAEDCLGRKAANTVGREGPGRVERCEVFGKWRARMSMAGFRPTALPAGAVESLRARAGGVLGTTTTGGGGVGAAGVAVKEENGGVGFAWNGRTITVTSAWR